MSEQVATNFQSSGSLGVVTMINESGKDLELSGIINGLSALTAEIAIQGKVPLVPLMNAIREVVAARFRQDLKLV
jgi:hypothetical protein